MFVTKGLLGFHRICAHTKNLHIIILKFLELITESLSLNRSSRGACFWKEPDQYFFPFAVFKGHILSILILK